jgi:plastocyanin
MRRTLAVLAVLLLAGCASAPPSGTTASGPASTGSDAARPSPPAVVEVHLTCDTGDPGAPCAFRPAEITVRAGETVRWVNDDATYHTVTSTRSLARRVPDGRFTAVLDAAGATFSRTFTQPGRYPYFCQPHAEFMAGVIQVI